MLRGERGSGTFPEGAAADGAEAGAVSRETLLTYSPVNILGKQSYNFV